MSAPAPPPMKWAADRIEYLEATEANQTAALKSRVEELTKALADEREECAKLADMVVADLSWHSKRAEAAGDSATMYRANTAWHRVKEVADLIRARTRHQRPPKRRWLQ